MPSKAQESEGKRLREARRSLGLRLEQFAAAAGVSAPTVSRWETGMYPIPEMGLIALETRLGINPSWVRMGQLPQWHESPLTRRAAEKLPPLELVSMSRDRNHGASVLLEGRDLIVIFHPARRETGSIWLVRSTNGLMIGGLYPDRTGNLYLYPPDNDINPTRGHFPPLTVSEADLIGQVWGVVDPVLPPSLHIPPPEPEQPAAPAPVKPFIRSMAGKARQEKK